MTKLSEWLRLIGAFVIVWYMALNDKFGKINSVYRFHVLILPIYLIILFGIVSVFILINQVIKIKNCDSAYNELKSEIEESRVELKKKGFKFD